ncbi:dihydroxyacetone kinase subunit DhaK [Nocardioides sp. WG-D5]
MATHDDLLALHAEPLFLARRDPASDRVAIVSGGGSGHEPLHTGLVGDGMLDAAVPGALFSSPTSLQVKAAVEAVDAGRGVVLVVKNYTGDVLNFSIARELLADRHDVEIVLVADDLATTSTVDGGPGRRGTAATIVVEKVCGAAARRGADLAEVAALGRRTVERSASLGVAYRACTNPLTGALSFDLAPDEIEMGIGIHGERGRETRPAGTADDVVEELVGHLVGHLALPRDAPVLLLVNGLGAAHPLELSVIARAARSALGRRAIRVDRSLVGTYVTALDMHGFSITLTHLDDELRSHWDAPVTTAAVSW